MIELFLPGIPLLLLLAALLFGRYPGLEAALRIGDRLASRARRGIAAALDAARPRLAPRATVKGGLLLAHSLSGRAPPA